MVIKEYENFTVEERDTSQSIWVEHLDKFCPPYEDGCRPCDLGCPCDRCQYDHKLQVAYVKDMVSRGCPITPREYDLYYEEE